jgi:hypothetical protein
MATRLSSSYQVLLVPEETYGTLHADLTGAVAMTDVTVEIKKGVILTETKIKTGTLVPQMTEKLLTGSDATVTLKGNLCSEYTELLKAYTHDDGTPYVMQATQPALFSYNIIQLFAVGTSASDTPYNLALGCYCVDFKITGEPNGIVQFESTWVAKSSHRGLVSGSTVGVGPVTTTLTNEPTAYTAGTPFLFGNITNTLFNAATKMNSFALNLSKTFADAKLRYQNSMTPNAEYLLEYSGTLELETIYNDAATSYDPSMEALMGSQTQVSNVINLVNSSKTWAMTIAGQVQDFTLADADKSLFTAKYTIGLAHAGSTAPLSIAVA